MIYDQPEIYNNINLQASYFEFIFNQLKKSKI